MKPIVGIFTLTVFIAMASPVSAALSYHGLETTINDDLSASTKVTLKFSSAENIIDYYTNIRVSDLKVSGNFGPVSCEDSWTGETSIISCSLSGISSDKNALYLEFNSPGAVNYSYGRYHYASSVKTSVPTERIFNLLKLPESATLAGYPANTSYSPSYGNTLTDGMRIMILWETGSISSNQETLFSAEYNMPPIGGGMIRYILIGAGVVIIIVILVAVFYIKKASKVSKTKVIASVLNTEEKRVVDIITAGGDSVLQKNIVRESGFSKAKVSRLVKSLGQRGIIKTEPVSGRENRILLAAGNEEKKAVESNEKAEEKQA